ncbi:MAG: DUF222 domain-containing protein, partial [Sciscionella sp.]
VELLRDTLHVTRDEVTRRLACAKAVLPSVTPTGAELPPPLPATADVLAAGQVGLDHVTVIATLHDTLPDTVHPDDWHATEQTLATLATQADSRAVARAARYARERLDPDGCEPKDTKERATRELDVLRMRDGSARGTFRLDPESAAILELLNSALAKPRPTTGGVRDPRSLVERQGDAFADILRLALNSLDLPAEAGERPHLVITMRLTDLQQQLRGALLHDGRDLTAGEARRHACDATLIPSVLGSHSEPLDLGRGHRLINLALRRALILRDRGCTFPNCDRPARWCDGHHIVHWSEGGATDITNCALLCGTHHTLMHDDHCEWEIRMVNGHPEFLPPKYIDPDRKPLRNTLHPTLE